MFVYTQQLTDIGRPNYLNEGEGGGEGGGVTQLNLLRQERVNVPVTCTGSWLLVARLLNRELVVGCSLAKQGAGCWLLACLTGGWLLVARLLNRGLVVGCSLA